MVESLETPEAMIENEETVSAQDKVYCANCSNCKVVKIAVGNGSQYQLRVRCAAGKWRKKLGDEKYYKYFTVARRSMLSCDSYEPMGDSKEFIKDLKNNLPIKDEIYSSTAGWDKE
ncbi:hypothetical protein [Spirochaeta cellobiosiphila]|uniref:hypothetical protein n=1 Tax=Spirochaeta cellobiosiphila TaxID=504483 RepID=UPI0003FD4037|nr:hypothetical protein [Spirochaeta cellobiosiphila]